MTDMKFNFSDVRKMSKTYDGGPKIVMEETHKGITKSVIAIEGSAKRLVPTDTHNLQRSLTHQVTTKGSSITGRAGTNLNYAQAVEDGRGAGKKMPPPNALIDSGWTRRHPAPADFKGTEKSWAFVVARAIGRRGIAGRPYLKPALDENRAGITKEMVAAIKRISTRLAAK